MIDPSIKQGRIDGLKYSLYLLHGRMVLNRHPAYLAALDDMKIFLEAALERTEEGDDMHSTASTEET